MTQIHRNPTLQLGIVACGVVFVTAYLFWWFLSGPATPSAKALAEIAMNSSDAAARERAAAALAGHPDASVEQLRNIWANSNDLKVRGAVALGLGAKRDWESVPLFVDALKDPSPLLRSRSSTAINLIVEEDLGFPPLGSDAERAAAIKIIEEKWPALRDLEVAKQKFQDAGTQPEIWKERLEKRKGQ